MKKIGLFFGTYNPIHNGHLMMANYILNHSDLNAIFFVVNPTAPFKKHDNLMPFENRYEMVKLACDEIPTCKLYASNIEKGLKPTYKTYDTVKEFERIWKQQDCEFTVIIGEDNFKKLHRWYRAEELMTENRIFVCPRGSSKIDVSHIPSHLLGNITLFDYVPQCDLSSTFIRNEIVNGHSINFYIPLSVNKYIKEHNLYTKKE